MNENIPQPQDPMKNYMLVALNDALQSFMVPSPPPLRYEQGVIQAAFHNLKMRQQEKAAERQANVAKFNNETVQQNLQKIMSTVMFQANVNDQNRELEHREKMRQEARIDARLKNEHMEMDVQLLRLELKRRLEDYENEKNKTE